ncbi:MAG: hypothetical protein ACJA1L_003502, partial [Paracoccaceae bacterium]
DPQVQLKLTGDLATPFVVPDAPLNVANVQKDSPHPQVFRALVRTADKAPLPVARQSRRGRGADRPRLSGL